MLEEELKKAKKANVSGNKRIHLCIPCRCSWIMKRRGEKYRTITSDYHDYDYDGKWVSIEQVVILCNNGCIRVVQNYGDHIKTNG